MRINQAQKAYTEIRKQLIARNIEPGERLPEKEWSLQLNVNRADIRQAFARLVGEGLLVAGDKGGVFVREFTEEQVIEYTEVRLILETAAAKLAIERATSEEVEMLEEICDHMDLMAENGYALGARDVDLRFHEVLVKMSHNKEFIKLYRLANLPLSINKSKIPQKEKEFLKRDAVEHRAIFDALRNKDVSKMVKLLSAGLERLVSDINN